MTETAIRHHCRSSSIIINNINDDVGRSTDVQFTRTAPYTRNIRRPSVRPSPDRELELYATPRGQFRPRVRVGVGSHLGFHSGRRAARLATSSLELTASRRYTTCASTGVGFGVGFFLRPLWMDDLLP